MTADPGWYPPQLAVGVTSSRIRAMCAIDALGIAGMLGKDVTLTSIFGHLLDD